jgi:hypothetical protein
MNIFVKKKKKTGSSSCSTSGTSRVTLVTNPLNEGNACDKILEDSGKHWLCQYCRYWKILENTGYTNIADTGRFWKILVIPVLQILED